MSEYTIVVKDSEWEKILTYVDLCNKEIACFGYITPHEAGYMYVDEVFLVPQEVTGSEVDFTGEGLPYAVEKSIADGRVNDLRFLVHSHVNMGAFWSGTDENMIEKLGSTGAPWFVNAVFNKDGKHKCRLDLFESGVPGLGHIKNIDLDIMPEGSIAIRENALKEIEEFVKIQKPSWNKNHGKKGKGKGSAKHPPKKDAEGKEESSELVVADHALTLPGMLHPDDFDEAVDLYTEALTKSWIICEHEGMTYFYDNDGTCQGTCITLQAWDHLTV